MSRRALVPIAVIVGVELVIAAIVLATGFVAVSDDDFSRVVIAQGFVAHPRLDPSNSSWLPLPFLVLGSVMSLFGRGLAVARVVALGEAVVALLLVYRAAKNLELSERAAVASAVIAAMLPTAARLGVSFQPEALTAGLVVYGASTLVTSGRERVLGGLALGGATLCRYEAWPAAVAFAICCAVDAARRRARTATPMLVGTAACALVPVCLWMLHGAVAHGSPVFFFHRVASYREALGETESLLASLIGYPAAFVCAEPELVVAAIGMLVLSRRRPGIRVGRFTRPAVPLVAVLLFLVAGRIVGGAPTHHDARPLLPIMWALVMFVASWLLDGGPSLRRDVLAVATGAAVCGLVVRLERTPEPFANRTGELALGEEAKRRLGPSDRLLVETGDYGYFAVIAAFGAPERAEPFDRHDPRDVPAPDAFASPAALRARLAERGARWFVAPQSKRAIVEDSVGVVAAHNETLALFQTAPPAEPPPAQ